jgi:hypothetical protein
MIAITPMLTIAVAIKLDDRYRNQGVLTRG